MCCCWRYLFFLVTIASFFCGSLSFAQPLGVEESAPNPAYLAQIEVHTVAELHGVLARADKLFADGDLQAGSDLPVAFVLHGPEAKALLRNNYQQNKATVDLAARLSAFQVVDIKVCETWMKGQKIDATLLPPFIGTVPYAPDAIKRLMEKQGYVYF